MKKVYYILMRRGFANEADIISTTLNKEKDLQKFLDDNFGHKLNAKYRRIKLIDAKKYEKYHYNFDDFRLFSEFTSDLNSCIDPTQCRIYFNNR
jgi:hypothetical protein